MAERPEPDQHRPETPEIELGIAGASARARYDALRRRDDQRRRQAFGRLAPLARLLAGPTASTEAWGRGAQGEERTGALLRRAVGDRGIVLHDRAVPRVGPSAEAITGIGPDAVLVHTTGAFVPKMRGAARRGARRSNLDHIAVVPSGVWVVDSKRYRGRLERRAARGWFRTRPVLSVGGRDRTELVAGALRQRALVAGVVGPGVPVRVALCFSGVELSLFARPFIIDEVLVTWPRPLARTLVAAGPLDEERRHALAALLARTFPPYAPSGTSHNPTGAPPSG